VNNDVEERRFNMQVWLVRHAIAAERDGFQGPDAERPLTAKGRKRFAALARRLCRSCEPPQLIAASPLVRTLQTARLLAKAAGLRKQQVMAQALLAPGASADEMIDFLNTRQEASIALVGHEPDLSCALSRALGGGHFDVGKGCVALIAFDGRPRLGAGRLQLLVAPRLVCP
jgi:phosphohistidine phosphatase